MNHKQICKQCPRYHEPFTYGYSYSYKIRLSGWFCQEKYGGSKFHKMTEQYFAIYYADNKLQCPFWIEHMYVIDEQKDCLL